MLEFFWECSLEVFLEIPNGLRVLVGVQIKIVGKGPSSEAIEEPHVRLFAHKPGFLDLFVGGSIHRADDVRPRVRPIAGDEEGQRSGVGELELHGGGWVVPNQVDPLRPVVFVFNDGDGFSVVVFDAIDVGGWAVPTVFSVSVQGFGTSVRCSPLLDMHGICLLDVIKKSSRNRLIESMCAECLGLKSVFFVVAVSLS